MLVLSSSEIEGICDLIDPVSAVREALLLHAAGHTCLPAEAYMAWDEPGGGRARTLNMPGLVGGSVNAVGTKIINGNPTNIERGLPRASGLTLLFDRDSGRIVCLLDAGFISALRTAAVSLLCIEKLHVPAPLRLGICGAGYLAHHHIRLLAARCSVGEISIFDLRRERAERLRDELSARGIQAAITVRNFVEDVVSNATCLVTTTTTVRPYIDHKMIRLGTLLINISLDDFHSDVFMKADKLYVDDWSLISADQHRLLGRLIRDSKVVRSNCDVTVGARAIDGTIGELLSGACHARASESDIILVNPFGMAIEDIAVAQAVYLKAIDQNVGHLLMNA
jgi:N-[(2S)-2-amino-2-carboxyethyl]-L-glutamate dehydrogenase